MTAKAPRPNSTGAASEYDKFEKLTRKLVRVPKREIDAQRAKNGNGKKPKN